MSSNKSVGVFTTDRTLTIRMWDPVLAQFTGIPAESAVGKPVLQVLPDLEARGLLRYLHRALQDGVVEVLAPVFHKYLIRCATVRPSRHFEDMRQLVTIAPLEDEGKIEGVIVKIEDVTARLDRERDARLQSSEPGDSLTGLDDESWRVRSKRVEEVATTAAPEAIAALLEAVRDRHHNLGLLNSALKVLALTDVDTRTPLVELLQSGDSDLRIQAALALGAQKDPRAAAELLEALSDPNVNVVYQAIEGLGKLRSRAAVERLLAIAEREDFFLAYPAIEALGEIGDVGAAERLVPFLERETLCDAAATALGKIGDESIVSPLANLLNRTGASVDSVARALADLQDRYAQTPGAGARIARMSNAAIDARGVQNLLETLARNTSSNIRPLVQVLGWLDSPAAARALALHLGRPDLRNEVIEALARHGALVTGLLVEQLRSEDLDVRSAAITALGRIRDARAAPALIEELREDTELTISIIAALTAIADPSAIEPLFGLVRHPDAAVRRATVSALNALAGSGMADRVAALLNDSDPLARETAVRIAGYFGYPNCRDALMARCDDEAEIVRRAAIEHLPFLEHPQALHTLTKALRADSPGVRAVAARAMAHVDAPEAASRLIDALHDVDPWVRYYAARALGRKSIAEASDALEEVARSDKHQQARIAAFEALAGVNANAAQTVARLFAASQDPDLQRAAAAAIRLPQPPETEGTS